MDYNINPQIFYSQYTLNKIGYRIVQLIYDRTMRGVDRFDQGFKGYSSRPFALPAGTPLIKGVTKKLIKEGRANYFRTPDGKLKVLFHGGYTEFKQYVMKKTAYGGEVNLTLTGTMLNAMTVLKAQNNTITIGWLKGELSQRALYNIQRGRDFLGLSPNDLNDLVLKRLIGEGLKV